MVAWLPFGTKFIYFDLALIFLRFLFNLEEKNADKE